MHRSHLLLTAQIISPLHNHLGRKLLGIETDDLQLFTQQAARHIDFIDGHLDALEIIIARAGIRTGHGQGNPHRNGLGRHGPGNEQQADCRYD